MRTSTSRTSNITTGSWSLLPFSGLTRWRHPTGVPVTIRQRARGLSLRMKMSCKRGVESYTFHRSLRSGTKVQVQSTFGGGYTQQFRCARFGTIYRLGKGSVYPFALVNMAKKRWLKRFELDTIWPIRLAFVFLFFCGAFTRLYVIVKKIQSRITNKRNTCKVDHRS